MQMCKSHWWLMKESVHARGLWPLVATDGAQVVYRMQQEIEETADDSTYDPLMAVTHMINTQALKMGGAYMLVDNFCPLCEVNKYLGMGTDVEWVKGCMDSISQYCIERKLVPPTPRERIRDIRYAVEELPASEKQTQIAVLLDELARFIEQDEAVRFTLHQYQKEQ